MFTRSFAIIGVMVLLRGRVSSALNKTQLKNQVVEMFNHAYRAYSDHAWLSDELMPLSCGARVRGRTPSRGDVDDALGNYALTLIDTLDTLAVMGDFEEFERACEAVIDFVSFDQDIVVSVFEANIRVVGGLISAHLMAEQIRDRLSLMEWYDRELLDMAADLATRLIPAFNTSTGLPYPRVNLKHGVTRVLKQQQDTCTACGGSIILEFAALSRLTGNPIFEEKATKAMDFLWQQRHRTNDLMGTVLNIHNGDWIRKDSGVGAGIDSYYEYCLKAYILLGLDLYLDRFNKHYLAINRYMSQGPLLVDVQMHRPEVTSRGFVDALHAFWPGLQVLAGDLQRAIQTHELLYQVVQRHFFLPEVSLSRIVNLMGKFCDIEGDVYLANALNEWRHLRMICKFIGVNIIYAQSLLKAHISCTRDDHEVWHPLNVMNPTAGHLRNLLATRDPHYLEVGKQVIDSLNKHSRVKCGFAAVRDVRTMQKEDRWVSSTYGDWGHVHESKSDSTQNQHART